MSDTCVLFLGKDYYTASRNFVLWNGSFIHRCLVVSDIYTESTFPHAPVSSLLPEAATATPVPLPDPTASPPNPRRTAALGPRSAAALERSTPSLASAARARDPPTASEPP